VSRRKARRNPPLAVLFNPRGKVLSREVHSLAYRHDDDGKAYRHDFEGPVKAQLNGDGSVTLRSAKGRTLWKDYPERPYLVNPTQKESRMARRTKKAATRARRGKRPPPKGYSSWKDYMAAIRPGAAKPKRARTHKEAPMARKKSSKGRSRKRRSGARAVVHHTASRKVASHRRRYRRNPPGGRIVGNILQAGVDAVQVVGGEVLARGIPSALGIDLQNADGSATAMGLGAQAAVAVALAVGLDFVKPGLGRMAAAGALAAPLRSVVKGAQLPWVSDQLSGSDGFYFGSYPQGLSDYPQLVDADTDLGSYPTAQLQMQA